MLGQVQDDLVAAAVGDPGRDTDQVSAQGAGAGGGVVAGGQRGRGVQQVVRDPGTAEPGGIGGEHSRGQVGQGSVDQLLIANLREEDRDAAV